MILNYEQGVNDTFRKFLDLPFRGSRSKSGYIIWWIHMLPACEGTKPLAYADYFLS
jgi:hypothetical protein